MSDFKQQDAVPARKPITRPSGEKPAWWIVFGVLVFSIVIMLGAWN